MNYLNKDTGTAGKVRSTLWAESISIKQRCGGLCVYLVGSPLGLERHVEDKKRLGYTDLSKHVIVECDVNTYEALSEWCRELYPEIKVILGDFLEVCKELNSGTVRIEHLDFDSVESFGFYSEEVVAWAIAERVSNIHVVNSCRSGNGTYMADKAREMSMPFVIKWGWRRYIYGPPKVREMIPVILSVYKDKYDVQCMSYRSIGKGKRGGQGMIITVLNLR